MSTAQKLWLGYGLLVLLLVGSGLFVAARLKLIDRALATIMSVQEPVTAASYELAIDVSSSSSEVLAYVNTGNPESRARVDTLRATFDQLKRNYDEIARSEASRFLGQHLAVANAEFRAVGDTLMRMSDQRRQSAEAFARVAEATERTIQRELSVDPDGRGRDLQRRALLEARLEADVQGIAAAIGHYLRTRDPHHKLRIGEHEAHFRLVVSQLRELKLDDDALRATKRAERAFEEFDAAGGLALASSDELRDTETRFTRRAATVQQLVDEAIHSLARTDLVEAQYAARRALSTSLLAVLVLLVAGIVIGSLTALPTGRSIVQAEARIREQAEQLRLRNEDLALAHRRKDEFLGVLGHELRNPLAPLSNALHVLAGHEAELPPEVRSTHDMMRRQVRNMARLVDDLLDVSRINEGKITLRREPVDLGMVCAEVAQDLRPAADRRHHHIELAVPRPGPRVSADPTRLAQVVSNLLYNAVKYTPVGGHIRLEVESEDGQVLLRVRDNGIGIAPDMQSRIFEPFVQGNAAIPQQGGLGIGLTLVRRLVELHDGRIEAESAGPGLGSTFTVRLPVLRGAPPLAPARSARPAVPPRRVLVVDDNEDAATTLASLLELWGHHVRVAHDGDAALAAAAAEPPDLVLLDIGLPGMDGYAVSGRMRALRPPGATRIVALTGFGQESDRRRALESGFDDHMTKPVHPEALRDQLARAADPAPPRPA